MNLKACLPFLVLALVLSSCKLSVSSFPTDGTTTTNNPPAATDIFTSTLISNQSYTSSGTTYNYQLIKSQSGSKNPTYMQWIPNTVNATAGAVIIYYPYEGIDWTGEAVDAKWAARGAGAHNDDDAPYYNASTSSQFTYTPMAHVTAAQSMSIFTANNLHVLIVYGRFYSGTTIEGDVQAVVDGYRFLNEKSVVDKNKIGIYSGSWGGVGTLYGSKAATAGYSLKPKAISLAYPVSDVKQLFSYMDSIPSLTSNGTKQAQYTAFFDPYMRRANKATEALAGLSTRYDQYSRAQLATNDASTFIIHDKWDTLVPSSFTTNLFSTMSLSDNYVYFQPHSSAIDFDTFAVNHSQSSQPVDYTTALTWNYLFLIAELTDPAAVRGSSFSLSVFTAQFQHMVAMHTAGQDTSSFNKVLGLLCRQNLFMNNIDNSTPYAGSFVLHFMMNNYYQGGWSVDNVDACAKLITNPPF